jgi:DNA-directed RNA polymerase specialized sigma24 family protein
MSSNRDPLNATSASRVSDLEDLLHPRAGNDNATQGGIPDTTALVACPDVVRCIRTTLRRHGVARQDMDDAIADVQAECIEAVRTRRAACSLAQWKALAATIAVRWALDRLREAKVRSKYDVGFCEDADAFVRPTLHWEHLDPIDRKKYLAVLKDLFDSGQMPEHGEEILQGEADEVPHEQIAAEIGVSTTVVDNRLYRMRSKFFARLAALGMLSVVVLLLGVLVWPVGEPDVSAPRATRADAAAPVGSVFAKDGGVIPALPENRRPPSEEIAPFPLNQVGGAKVPRLAP